MRKFIITGAAIVSPIGTGTEDIWNAIQRGVCGIRRPTKVAFKADLLCGEIRDFDLGDYISDKRFRRAAPISKFALSSVALALGEAAGSDDNENAALVMAITHGVLGYTQVFHKELLEDGPDAVSPIYFSDSVLNAPAGNTSICFGIRGPVLTILGGPEAAVKSMMTACRIIADGSIEKAIVVSAEELNELSLSCYRRQGFSQLSEGAGAIVIERQGAVAQSTPYCYIAGMASECNPFDPDAALENSLNLCLYRAGLRVSDIDLVMADPKASSDQLLKGVPTATIRHLTGNAFAVSVLWEVVLSAMAIKKGTVPQNVIRSGGVPSERVNNVLLCTSDRLGSAAALILSKHE
jgi:3-oxoacyl-(acyl-carrier-protein) synthase